MSQSFDPYLWSSGFFDRARWKLDEFNEIYKEITHAGRITDDDLRQLKQLITEARSVYRKGQHYGFYRKDLSLDISKGQAFVDGLMKKRGLLLECDCY